MPTRARVCVLPKDPGPLEVVEVDLPDPGPHQVVVKLFSSGVCHSQLHQMHQERENATVLGHEGTGQVLEVGSDVTGLEEGDTVIVTWVPKDARNSDRAPATAEISLADGRTVVARNVFTWADHTIADEQYVVKVADDINKEVTSIIGCAVMTGAGAVENTANVQKGDSVAVFGVGGVGLSAVVAAKVRGANPIIAVDLDDDKLEMARQFGATHLVNAAKENPVKAIKSLTIDNEGRTMAGQPRSGADFVFDCIGIKTTMEQIVPSAKTGFFGAERGGTAVLVGVPQEPVELNAADVLVNEKKFIGSIGGSCCPSVDFPRYLDWHASGQLDLEALVTERYTIDQINEATTALDEGRIFGRAILVY